MEIWTLHKEKEKVLESGRMEIQTQVFTKFKLITVNDI